MKPDSVKNPSTQTQAPIPSKYTNRNKGELEWLEITKYRLYPPFTMVKPNRSMHLRFQSMSATECSWQPAQHEMNYLCSAIRPPVRSPETNNQITVPDEDELQLKNQPSRSNPTLPEVLQSISTVQPCIKCFCAHCKTPSLYHMYPFHIHFRLT